MKLIEIGFVNILADLFRPEIVKILHLVLILTKNCSRKLISMKIRRLMRMKFFVLEKNVSSILLVFYTIIIINYAFRCFNYSQ